MLSLGAFAAAVAGAFAVMLLSVFPTSRAVPEWTLATVPFWMGSSGFIVGLCVKHDAAPAPAAAGWALPVLLFILVCGPIAPNSVWPDHVEQIVKTSWLVMLPIVGMLSQFYGTRIRRGTTSIPAWLFVLALFALTAGYHIAISKLNSVYPER